MTMTTVVAVSANWTRGSFSIVAVVDVPYIDINRTRLMTTVPIVAFELFRGYVHAVFAVATAMSDKITVRVIARTLIV